MKTLPLICVVVGIIIELIGHIGFVIAEFKTSILWGLCGLLFPIVNFVYTILHFSESKKWLGYMLFGFALVIVGLILDI